MVEHTTSYLDYLIIAILSFGFLFSLYCLFLIIRKKSDPKVVYIFCGFLTLAVWPIAFGSISIQNLEKAKSVEFCGSCHEMEDKATNLKNPRSRGLAAKHATRFWINQNPCYECHTDYTMFGPLGAKWRGLRHMYAAAISKPDPAEIKLYEPFPDVNCVRCHKTLMFEREEDHEDIDFDERCVDCHNKIHPKLKPRNF